MTPTLPQLQAAVAATLRRKVGEVIGVESSAGRVFIVEYQDSYGTGTLPVVAIENGEWFAVKVGEFVKANRARYRFESPKERYARARLAYSKLARALARVELEQDERAAVMGWAAALVGSW